MVNRLEFVYKNVHSRLLIRRFIIQNKIHWQNSKKRKNDEEQKLVAGRLEQALHKKNHFDQRYDRDCSSTIIKVIKRLS